MKNIKITAILLNLVLAFVGGVALGDTLGVNPLIVGSTIFALGTVPQFFKISQLPSGVLFGTIQTQVWLRDIQENLFAGNQFQEMSLNDAAFVINKTVNLPQAGSNPGVEVNRSVIPATLTQRDDTADDYDLDSYTTDPVLIQDVEDIQNSFDKRNSVLRQHVDILNERIALQTMFNWAASSAKVVLTSGSSDTILAPGATGTRLALILKDFAKLSSDMTKDNIPNDGNRILLLDAALWFQLSGADTTVLNADLVNTGKLATGIQQELFGFKIMLRSATTIYSSANEPKAVGAVSATGDNLAGLAWHPSFVRKALGNIKIFANNDDPLLFGSSFSAEVLYGSAKARPTTEVGTFALVQAS